MCLKEYSEEEIKEMFKKDGREEGIEETRISDVKNIMKKLGMTVEQALDLLDIPEREREVVRKSV